LQVPRTVSRATIEAKFRELARARHPDRGGSDHAMAELNRAHDRRLRRSDHEQRPRRNYRPAVTGDEHPTMTKKDQRDRRPASQRSPYDFSGRGRNMSGVEKMGPKIEECRPGAVHGCGNPQCDICLPRDGRSPGGALGGGSSNPGVYGFVDFAPDIARMVELTFRTSFENDRRAFERPPGDEAKRRAKEAARHAEEQARTPIEKYLPKAEHQIDWTDIVGNEEAHKAMIEAIEFPVKHRDLYRFYNKKPMKGILLRGPPGCGNTMLGKAASAVIAKLHGKQSSSLLSIGATELQQPYVGETEKIIRQIFAYARAYKALYGHQLVVFIDEADAILPSRDGGLSRRALPWEESNVSTFLTEMDGARGICSAGDPRHKQTSCDRQRALLRDGRRDRKITVRRPTEEAARAIFSKALSSAPVIGDRDALVEYAMQEFFSPLRHLLRVKTDKGLDYLTLGHIVSGAMMAGPVERAKANAFHRILPPPRAQE
jgi:SpoVK/Ycf46/Vps4 family AAA+-type ATPase